MLQIRPNCEWCDEDLPPDAPNARICSYECTYCAHCVDGVLQNVCPTCGGNFAPRPIRPRRSWREDLRLGLEHHPASTQRQHSRWMLPDLNTLSARLKAIDPRQR